MDDDDAKEDGPWIIGGHTMPLQKSTMWKILGAIGCYWGGHITSTDLSEINSHVDGLSGNISKFSDQISRDHDSTIQIEKQIADTLAAIQRHDKPKKK